MAGTGKPEQRLFKVESKATELAIVVPLRKGYAAALREFEKQYFGVMNEESRGNVSFGARAAGLDRNTYRRHAVSCGVLGNEQQKKV